LKKKGRGKKNIGNGKGARKKGLEAHPKEYTCWALVRTHDYTSDEPINTADTRKCKHKEKEVG